MKTSITNLEMFHTFFEIQKYGPKFDEMDLTMSLPTDLKQFYVENKNYQVFFNEYFARLRCRNQNQNFVHSVDENNYTILHYAIIDNNFELIEFLIDKNYVQLIDFGPPMMNFVIKFGNLQTLEFLVNIYEVIFHQISVFYILKNYKV